MSATRMPDVQHKCNGICCGVETRVYGMVFYATWSESKRRLLSWSRPTAEREAVAMHQGNIGWQFHIPTGQRTCTQSAWQSHFYAERRQTSFLPTSGPKQPRYRTPWVKDLGCNATEGLREMRKWRRRAVPAPVECVTLHWTKHHRRSDRSVACATESLPVYTIKRRSFWAPYVK